MILSPSRGSFALIGALACLSLTSPAQSAGLTIDVPGCTTSLNPVISGNTLTLNCTPASSSGPPSGCSIGGPTTARASTLVTLTMNCGGGAATNWTWKANGVAIPSANAQTYSTTFTATTTFEATASNADGPSAPASKTVTLDTSTPPVTGGGSISCPGFADTKVIDMTWSSPTRMLTSGFGPNDALVVRFTTGTVNSPINNLPKLVAAEYGSPPSDRRATLSDTACDFGTGLSLGASVAANTITSIFSVGPNNTFYYPALSQSKTYYLNIKNGPASTCAASGSCNMYVELLKPGGL